MTVHTLSPAQQCWHRGYRWGQESSQSISIVWRFPCRGHCGTEIQRGRQGREHVMVPQLGPWYEEAPGHTCTSQCSCSHETSYTTALARRWPAGQGGGSIHLGCSKLRERDRYFHIPLNPHTHRYLHFQPLSLPWSICYN